jgi:putative N6-adenine-specific DNA methylase
MPRYFASSPKGVEAVTARELVSIGAEGVEPDEGGVHFEGDRAVLYRAHLHLRTAMRVLCFLREFASTTPEMLYDQVRRVKWDRLIRLDQTFAVHCVIARRSNRRGLNHSHFVELKIKDGIADEMRKRVGARPDVDTRNPDLRVHAYLSGGRCRLSLDASGESLHKRGYRAGGREAPLKETLAAAILDLAGWDGSVPLIDPMCGSGTLPIEALLRARGIPPGLDRTDFAFMRWAEYDDDLWQEISLQARQGIRPGLQAPITGFDADPDAVRQARKNAASFGDDPLLRFERQRLDDLAPVGDAPGVVILNPPYGKRMGEEERLHGLYRRIGDVLKQRMTGWRAFIFTGNLQLAKHVGLRTKRRITLFNGPIECRLLEYELY